MSLVLDASAATAICLSAKGFDLVKEDLKAPLLLKSEVLAAIQGLAWRKEISHELAEVAVSRLLNASTQFVRRQAVWTEARRIATQLGWAKTYDAEYVAVAVIEGCPLLTLDTRLARRVREIIDVRVPGNIG